MQFVNDDMDDLFRRAAEEYPLKTDSGNWDKVREKMQAVSRENSSNKKGKKAKYLLLLVLIPLLLICTTYIKNDSTNGTGKTINEETIREQSTSTWDKKAITKTKNKNNISANNEISLIPLQTEKQPQEHVTNKTTRLFAKDIYRNKNFKSEQAAEKNIVAGKKLSSDIEPETEIVSVNKENNKLVDKLTDTNNQLTTTSTSADKNTTVPDQDVTAIKENKTIQKDSTQAPLKTTATKEKTIKKKDVKLYFGLLAGPDFSMVKSTNVKGIGYSFGLLAGYNFSKKLAVEAGVMWDRKSYQSEGRHFSTEKLNWPHVKILEVSGYCDMYEIPLNLRYNFSANSKRTLFASAGLSSYLMKNENYDYSYERYGIYQYGSREYKNTTTNWLSIAHLSIGLQKKLRSIGDLRIEPYVKLPVNGVGIGSMPLRSTGIYLGITRPIR